MYSCNQFHIFEQYFYFFTRYIDELNILEMYTCVFILCSCCEEVGVMGGKLVLSGEFFTWKFEVCEADCAFVVRVLGNGA